MTPISHETVLQRVERIQPWQERAPPEQGSQSGEQRTRLQPRGDKSIEAHEARLEQKRRRQDGAGGDIRSLEALL
jgi:hypothetical protein